MTKINTLEQAIMEARIDELRHQVHMLERQLILSSQSSDTDGTAAGEAEKSSDVTQICVGVG